MTDISRIKTIMDNCINSHSETGAAFVCVKDGKELMSYSCGLADYDKKTAMTGDTICRAFSCSKVATAICAMMLIERGQLDIENNLEWYIPEFANPVYFCDGKEVPCSRSIKIRDLLNMTSGIAYPGDGRDVTNAMGNLWGELDASIKEGKSMTTLEFAKKAGKCPLMFDVGNEWMYGSSADILGAVIEIITGTKLSAFMEENIFKPLGMNDTAFYVPEEKLDRLAVLYDGAGENPKKLDWVNLCIYDTTTPPSFESGGAGLFSTANDYAKLGAMLSNSGEYNGKRILGRKTIEFMCTNALTDLQKKTLNWDSTKGYGYANLVRMVANKNEAGTLASLGSFGWDGWTGTYILNDPVEKLSVILFVQRAGAGTTYLSRTLVNAVYSMI